MKMTTNPITFSVITPTLDRDGRYGRGTLKRCLKSIVNQTYDKDLYEHVIVDDGNVDSIAVAVEAAFHYNDKISHQIVRHDCQMERLISYNDGFKAAKNDWICLLDDDDEYIPFYLEYIAHAIKTYPDYKVFNFGGLVTNKKDMWVRARDVVPFKHEIGAPVESGQIVNGQFVFHKSCLEKTGLYPETGNCYDFADLAGIPGYSSSTRTLGNPMGNDFYLFYKLTRHFISKPLDLYLYICHLRQTE